MKRYLGIQLAALAALTLSACTDPAEVCDGDRRCIEEVQAYNAYRTEAALAALAQSYSQSAAFENYYNSQTAHTVYQGGATTTYNGYATPQWRGY